MRHGSAAFLVLLMRLCNNSFNATHYALLSALVLSETIGWPTFFVLAVLLGLPGLYMVWRMRAAIMGLMEGL